MAIAVDRFDRSPVPGADSLVNSGAGNTAGAPAMAGSDPFGGTKLFNQPTFRNAMTLHSTAADSQRALLDSIASAESSFVIQTFEVIAALAARKRRAAAEGKPFEVRVLIDGMGMRAHSGDRAVVRKLAAIGANVRVFEEVKGNAERGDPFSQDNDVRGTALTHRKLYIQDGARFMTGGRNIGDEYLQPTYKDKSSGKETNSWHDLLVTIEGDETARAIGSFYQDWVMSGGQKPVNLPTTPSSPTGRIKMQSFDTDPEHGIFSIRSAHQTMIEGARKEIVLMVPYLSDDTLIDQLIAAKFARPSLSIKIMLPEIGEPTLSGRIFTVLNARSAAKLSAAGIEVRMCGGGTEDGVAIQRFSHIKGLVVDRRVLSVGSANGDARSYRANHESITVMDDPATTQKFLDEIALPDWDSSRPYDPRLDTGLTDSLVVNIATRFKGLL